MTGILDVLRHEVLNHAEVRGSKIPGDQILYGAPDILSITIAVIFLTYKNVGPEYETCFMSPYWRLKFGFFFFFFNLCTPDLGYTRVTVVSPVGKGFGNFSSGGCGSALYGMFCKNAFGGTG